MNICTAHSEMTLITQKERNVPSWYQASTIGAGLQAVTNNAQSNEAVREGAGVDP